MLSTSREPLRAASALVALASALLALGVGGCGSKRRSPRAASEQAPSTPAAAQRNAESASEALRTHGALIAGTLWPKAVVSGVECTSRVSEGDRVDCSFGQGVGGEDPSWFEVRMQPDGMVSKVLGKATPVPGAKSSTQTAVLLAADDELQRAPSRSRDYECKRSPRLDPDGTRADSTSTGRLCSTHFRVADQDVRRYVEFADDGTATRDYLLQTK